MTEEKKKIINLSKISKTIGEPIEFKDGKIVEKPTAPDKSIELMKEMQSEIQKLKQDQRMLLEVADKRALSRFYSRNQGKAPAIVKLRTMNGKVIRGWKTTKDEEHPDQARHKGERIQKTMLLYEDGTSEEMAMTDFWKKYTHIECRRTGITTDETTGQVTFKLVRLDNGKEYEVGVQFCN